MSSKKQFLPKDYNKEYFLSDYLEGYREYKKGELSAVKQRQLTLLDLKKGIKMLEIGFGRGELLLHSAKKGANVTGIDFSRDAYEIAQNSLWQYHNVNLQIADCRDLPFEDNSFERVFSGDLIEHFEYQDAILMLKEMQRVLRTGGFMLVHTAPNAFFRNYVYPLVKHLVKLIDKNSVKMIDHQFYAGPQFHIHEYNLFSLKKIARKAGLTNIQAWIDEDILRSSKHRFTKTIGKNWLVKRAVSFSKYSVIRFFFGNDIYLKKTK